MPPEKSIPGGQRSAPATQEVKLTGPMTWTGYALDAFVAPSLSKFKTADIQDRSATATSSSGWVGSFTLRSIFVRPPKAEEAGKYAFQFVRRAASMVRAYEAARIATSEFFKVHSPRNPALSIYARAVDYWEEFLHYAQYVIRLLSLMSDMGGKSYEPGDGTLFERLNELCNAARHSQNKIPEEHEIADAAFIVWMENDGLHSAKHHITWVETAEIVDEVAKLAGYDGAAPR